MDSETKIKYPQNKFKTIKMKKIATLLVLASVFISCENESFEDSVLNEDTIIDTEETTDDKEDVLGNQ